MSWLEEHFNIFAQKVTRTSYDYTGLIEEHLEKCEGYKEEWLKNNIPFEHGVALFLLSYLPPFNKEVRETEMGHIDPWRWVIANYERFDLPLVDGLYWLSETTKVSVFDQKVFGVVDGEVVCYGPALKSRLKLR